MNALAAGCVVLGGTLVGLDVASGPQAMYSRPLIAGLIGGAAAGAPLPGLAVGALFELFALDTLPVGASRYPDWGPGTVALGALAAERPLPASGLLGLALLGVLAAWLGGWLTHVVREANGAALAARRAALDGGDVRAVRALHWGGWLRDAARSAALTLLVLGAGALLRPLLERPGARTGLAHLALGATTIGVALHASWRLGGRAVAPWLAAGLVVGVLVVARWLW